MITRGVGRRKRLSRGYKTPALGEPKKTRSTLQLKQLCAGPYRTNQHFLNLSAPEQEAFFAKVARKHSGKILIISGPIIGRNSIANTSRMKTCWLRSRVMGFL